LIAEHQMSERHACRLVGLSRDSYRHAPVASAQTAALRTKIVKFGDRVQLQARFDDGRAGPFGCIEQRVVLPG
jgi:hypothetical protein